jgi:hypothetical protein
MPRPAVALRDDPGDLATANQLSVLTDIPEFRDHLAEPTPSLPPLPQALDLDVDLLRDSYGAGEC